MDRSLARLLEEKEVKLWIKGDYKAFLALISEKAHDTSVKAKIRERK